MTSRQKSRLSASAWCTWIPGSRLRRKWCRADPRRALASSRRGTGADNRAQRPQHKTSWPSVPRPDVARTASLRGLRCRCACLPGGTCQFNASSPSLIARPCGAGPGAQRRSTPCPASSHAPRRSGLRRIDRSGGVCDMVVTADGQPHDIGVVPSGHAGGGRAAWTAAVSSRGRHDAG